MNIKSLLSELYALLDVYGEQYCNNKNVIAATANNDFINIVEQYKLPEVTKVICHNESLLNKYNEQKYSYVKELYCKDCNIDEVKCYIENRSVNDLLEYCIPLLSDKQIKLMLSVKKDTISQIEIVEKDMESLSTKLSSEEKKKELTSQIEDKEKKILEIEELINDNPDDNSLNSERDQKKKELSTLRGQLKKRTNSDEKILQAINIKEKTVLSMREFIRKYESFFIELDKLNELYFNRINDLRDKAYSIKPVATMFETVIEKIQSGTDLTQEEKQYTNKSDFCEMIHGMLFNQKMSLDDLDKIYLEGYIDIFSEPFVTHLKQKIETVCQFYSRAVETYHPFENEGDWCDLILRYAVEIGAFENGDIRFYDFWNSFKTTENINKLIDRICEITSFSNIKALCEMFLSSEGETRKTIRRLIERDIVEERVSVSEYLKELLYCKRGDSQNIDFALKLLDISEEEKNTKITKLMREKDKLNSKNRRLENEKSSKAYSCTYQALEQLEKTIIEIDPRKISDNSQSTTYRYISTKKNELIDGIVSLREGINVHYDVQPLVDIDDWAKEKVVPFNNSIHTYNGKKQPEKVKIVTMGFSYVDDEGQKKSKKSEVCDVNSIDTRMLFSQKPAKAIGNSFHSSNNNQKKTKSKKKK